MAETGTALTTVDHTEWRKACEREPIIRALTAEPRLGRKAIAEAGPEFTNCSRDTGKTQ